MSVAGPPPPTGTREKIAWAEACHRTHGKAVLGDPAVVRMTAQFRRAVVASHQEMAATGMVEICRRCEEEEGGSCCGAGLENRSDGWLLLTNLLLGCSLPAAAHDAESCYFLGPNGCRLTARHTICVNYVCRKITDQLSPGALARLREREGEELQCLFLLVERIKGLVRSLDRP